MAKSWHSSTCNFKAAPSISSQADKQLENVRYLQRQLPGKSVIWHFITHDLHWLFILKWQKYEISYSPHSPEFLCFFACLQSLQNTQEIKRTLFNNTEQNQTCKFWMESSFSSYAQYNRKQLNQLIFVRWVPGSWRKEKSSKKMIT